MAGVSFKRYVRWVTFWSAVISVTLLVALSPFLLPAREGLLYALAIGLGTSIVSFRVSCADAESLSDLSAPRAARAAGGRAFARLALLVAALVGAAAASGWSPVAVLVAAAGLFLTKAVVIVEAMFGLAGR